MQTPNRWIQLLSAFRSSKKRAQLQCGVERNSLHEMIGTILRAGQLTGRRPPWARATGRTKRRAVLQG